MKYNPKINEKIRLACQGFYSPILQAIETVQGNLALMFQPAGMAERDPRFAA